MSVPESLTPQERSLRARLAAYTMHSLHDPRETSKPGREAFLAGFLDRVDPDRVLPEGERLRRADCARKAHMQRLALASSRARRKGSAA